MEKTYRAAIIGYFAALVLVQPAAAQDRQSALLPRETVAAFSILNGKEWQNRWKSTGLSKFFSDPAVREYLASVTRGAKSEAAWIQIMLPGDNPVEVTGQFTYALIATGTGFEHLVQLDCDNSTAAANWTNTMSARLKEQHFVQDTGTNSLQILKSESGDNTVAFSTKGRRGLACTNPAILKQLLSSQYQPLVQSPEFNATVNKALHGNHESLFWWFARPIELTLRDPTDKQAIADYQMMRSQGFDALQAIGGTGTIDVNTNRIKSTGYAAIQRPLRLAARLLDLNDSKISAIPDWCTAATSCGFFNLQTSQFLEHYSTLFDALYGEGETGVFAAVLDDLKQRNDGPQIDLQRDLIQYLDQQVFFATVQGQTRSSCIIGIPTSAPKRVAAAVNKLFLGDSRAINQSGPNHKTWKIMPLDDGYGIKEEFVISIRDDVMFVAPNVSLIDYMIQNAAISNEAFAPSGVAVKLAYRIDFEKFAGRLFAQLKSKQFSKSADSLLTRMKLKESILGADPAKLPQFETVRRNFDSVLNIFGTEDGNNWELTIETR